MLPLLTISYPFLAGGYLHIILRYLLSKQVGNRPMGFHGDTKRINIFVRQHIFEMYLNNITELSGDSMLNDFTILKETELLLMVITMVNFIFGF